MTFGSKMSHPSSKTRISALEKLKQSNAAKLELETKKMEERIRSLKEKMMKEKEERERLGGSRWTSGRTGPLTKNAQKNLGSKKVYTNGSVNKVPRKIKVLTDEPVDSYMRKPVAVVVNETPINLCGQCEKIASAWFCHECSEKYCDTCFNQFHLKGALRKHTKTKVGTEAPNQHEQMIKSPRRQEDSTFKPYGVTTEAATMRNDYMNGPSLLNGSYDEKESANSFAQALQEWRDQNRKAKTSPRSTSTVCTDTSCGTSNQSISHQDDKKEVTIKFNPTMSYGDRLYLKKNRENNLVLANLTSARGVSEKKGGSSVNKTETDQNDVGLAVEPKGKENNEPDDRFTPNYREMIQNITSIKSNPDISSLYQKDDIPPRRALSVQEISPSEMNTQVEQKSACIIEEYEEPETDNCSSTPRHGAVTICELYTSADHDKDLEDSSSALDSHHYVSPSIISKPFFLKPTGKVKVKKQPVRNISAGRKKTPRKNEQSKMCLNKEQEKLLSRKSKQDEKVGLSESINGSSPTLVYQSNHSRKQVPFTDEKEQRLSNTNQFSPRPPSNKNANKNKTRIPIRQAWKPKPNHKELSSFFLAGVAEGGEDLQQNEELHNERSSCTPITNLGRGSLSTTWNPIESYPQVTTPDSIDTSSSLEMSTPQRQHSQEHAVRGDPDTVTNVNTSDDLQLTGYKSEELEEASKYDKKNIGNKDKLLELTAIDDFDTGNQDDDDLATLNDLAWELASSTGRLTRCEEDFPLESDDDSIEDRDDGSGLTTPCTLERSFRESIMDDFEEMEKRFMEEDL